MKDKEMRREDPESIALPIAEISVGDAENDRPDDFWDIENLLPKNSGGAARMGSTHGNISRGRSTPSDSVKTSLSSPVRREAVLPKQQAAGGNQRSFADLSPQNGGRGAPPRRNMPLGELVSEYTPRESLLRQVKIRRWPSNYTFYEKFLDTARSLYSATGEKCEYTSFFSFMPQYQQLNMPQLRYYLWWRSNLRRGVCLQTDYCYLLLFIFEVLNLPDLLPPEKGARMLGFLWASYREKFPRLDKYLGQWLCDYCLIHAVPCPRDLLEPFLPQILNSASLREFYVGGGEAQLFRDGTTEEKGEKQASEESFEQSRLTDAFLMMTSSYQFRKSKYIALDSGHLFEKHIPAAMHHFLSALSKKDSRFTAFLRGMGAEEALQTAVLDSYTGAVCAFQWKRQIEINYMPLTSGAKTLSPMVTDAVKYCENCLRSQLGVKARFRAANLTEEMKAILDEYFRKNLPGFGRRREEEQSFSGGPFEKGFHSANDEAYEPLSGDFSMEQAASIEFSSRKAVELLALDGEEGESEDADDSILKKKPVQELSSQATAAEPHPPSVKEEAAGSGNPQKENETLRRALLFLYTGDGTGFRMLAKDRGVFPEVLAETVNNAALDRFGDVAAEEINGEYRLIEDYREDVEQWLREF